MKTTVEPQDNDMAKKATQSKPSTTDLEKIIHKKIGAVPNLQTIQIVPLFEDRYRVNVRVFNDANATVKVSKIIASYFLKFENGKITGGDEITKIA